MATSVAPETTAAPAAAPTSAPAAPSAPTPSPAPTAPSAAPQAHSHSWAELDAPDPFQSPTASDKPDPELKALFGGETEPAPETVPAEPTGDVVAEPEVEVEPIPFRYTSDGQESVLEGVHEVPGQGLIVDQEAVPKLKDIVQGHAHMRRQLAELGPRLQRMEQEAGQVTHQVGEQTYRGVAALEAVRAEAHATLEGSKAVIALLAKPKFVRELAMAYQNNDRDAAQAILAEAAQMAAGRYELVQTQGLRKADQMAYAPPAPAALSADVVTSGLQRQFGEIAKALETQGTPITPEDVQEAMAAYGPFAESFKRPATAEEARQLQIPVGTPILDVSKTHQWFRARAEFRSRERAAKASADAATKDNAARLAQSTPTRPANTRAAAPRPGQGTKHPEPAPKGGNWKRRMLAGQSPFPDAPSTANP